MNKVCCDCGEENESDVSYDILINVKKDMQTTIKSVDAAFVKKY